MAAKVAAAAVAAFELFLGSCTSGDSGRESQGEVSTGCSATVPSPHGPVPLPENPVVSNPGVPGNAVGNDFLWVAVPTDGVLHAPAESGGSTYSTKVGWWRVTAGELRIDAYRLDGAGVFKYEAGSVPEYGPTGFVPSVLTFSAPGCWRITGHVGSGALTFIARVV